MGRLLWRAAVLAVVVLAPLAVVAIYSLSVRDATKRVDADIAWMTEAIASGREAERTLPQFRDKVAALLRELTKMRRIVTEDESEVATILATRVGRPIHSLEARVISDRRYGHVDTEVVRLTITLKDLTEDEARRLVETMDRQMIKFVPESFELERGSRGAYDATIVCRALKAKGPYGTPGSTLNIPWSHEAEKSLQLTEDERASTDWFWRGFRD